MKNYGMCDVPKIENLKQLIYFAAETYGDKIAFSFERNKEEKSVSYKKLSEDVEALGTYFSTFASKGDRIAIYGENSYEWIVTYFATVNSDRVIVPIDKELGTDAVANLINDCGAKLLVYGKTKKKIVEELKESNVSSIDEYVCITELEEYISKGRELIEEGNTT